MASVNELVTSIRNAARAGHRSCSVRRNTLCEAVLRVLQTEGFITDYLAEGHRISVTLKVDISGRCALDGIAAVNHPGRRVYVAAKSIPRVRGGCGVVVLSTREGVLSGREARAKNVGGEVLAQVW